MRTLVFELAIGPDEYQRWYRGEVSMVQARTREGVRVRFPATAIQQYINHQGVHGRFAIHFDQDNKLIRVDKLV